MVMMRYEHSDKSDNKEKQEKQEEGSEIIITHNQVF
jgi:hypothetical protein